MTIIERSYRATRIERGTRWQLIVLAAAMFVVGTNAFVIAGVLPEIADGLDATVTQVSYTITWYSIIVAVASPVIASLLPRVSRTVLMASGLGIVTIGTLLTALAPTLDVFFAGRVIAAFGGAALVPTATAAAPGLVAPEIRGKAMAIVAAGFTLATALGAPLGTALASGGGWRLPLVCLTGLAAAFTVVLALSVRGIPTHAGLRFLQRFSVLGNWRIVTMLVVQALLAASFNVVYIFSSAATRSATHGSSSWLAVLLLLYGLGGVAGNWLGGVLADRIGAVRTAGAAIGLQAVVFVLMSLFGSSLIVDGILFAVWGLMAFAAIVPVQHRVVALEPELAGISLSWMSTAMYIGIAAAPILGAAALGIGTTALLLTATALAIGSGLLMLLTLAGTPRRPGVLGASV